MAGLGLAGGYGAGAAGATLGDILKQKFLEQMQRQQLAEQARQADMRQQTALQGMNLQQQNLDENRALRQQTLDATIENRQQQSADRADALKVREGAEFRQGVPLRIKGSYVSPTEKVQFNQAGLGGSTTPGGADEHSADPHFHFGGTAGQEMAKDKALTAEDLARDRMEQQAQLAKAASDDRRFIASQSSADRRYAADLANQGKVDARAEKTAAADKETANKRKAIVSSATETLGALDELADFDEQGNVRSLKPGVSALYGLRVPFADVIGTGNVAKAAAARDRLKARLIVDLISEMKGQSRTGATGFGQLNIAELKTLQDSASQLEHTNMPDTQVAAELSRIRQKVQRIIQEPGGAAPAGGTTGGAAAETPAQRYARLQKIANGGQ